MSVQSEITRLESAKAAIRAAIGGKGVTVPEGTLLDGMAALIESIQAGGGADSIIDRSITSITSSAAEVGQYAFYGCGQLETASFPEAAKICRYAFGNCVGLTALRFPAAKTIGHNTIHDNDMSEEM